MSASLDRSPWTPVLALDRLNSWLRAEQRGWCGIRSSLKPVIYWTKTQAILDLSKRCHIGMRRVMVRKPCRTCSATGIWLPDYWTPDDGDYSNRDGGYPCRNCEATGTVTLKFIETNIGPARWHTPSEKWYSSSLDVYVPFPSFHAEARAHTAYQYYQTADGWEPNQPGRPMSHPEVLRDMLIVLAAWPHDVCFSIDYHHRAGLERMWNCPDLGKAERWLHNLITTDALLAA